MKFRIVIEADELTIITENGGIACTREAEGDVGEPRVATTDYYQNYINSCSPATLFDELAEGEMEFKDWATEEYNNWVVIQDALEWLSPDTTWEICDDLFLDYFPKEYLSPKESLIREIANACESLSLDDHQDRETLISKLLIAL